MQYRIISTSTGPFAILQNDDGALSTAWVNADLRSQLDGGIRNPKLLPDLVSRLQAFFEGDAVDFSDVPLPKGGAFHRKCWEVCREIPRGEVICYQELAHRAGSPNGARAAGQAMRHNPLPVITPCHRVIGASGKLHGFGGSCDANGDALHVKSALLRMEGAIHGNEALLFAERSCVAVAV